MRFCWNHIFSTAFQQVQTGIATLLQAFQVLSPGFFGKRFVLTSGDRDCARQLELSGPTSFHLVGLAFDGVLQPYDARSQSLLGGAAEQLGFRWGGNFATPDVVHFDDGRRGTPGTCSTDSGLSLLSAVASILAAALGSGGGPGGSPGIEAFIQSYGRNTNGTNQTGSATSEAICGPQVGADGRLTGRVTCEPYVFRSSGSDSI
jgi:hypothetical protein